MKPYFRSIVTIAVILLGSAFGGIFDSTKVVLPHDGSQALEFRMSGLVSLSNFMNSTIAWKKFDSPNKATRYAINLTGSSHGSQGWADYYDFHPIPADSLPDTTHQDVNYKSINAGLSVVIQKMHYARPFHQLSLFVGYGPLVGIGLDHQSGQSFYSSTAHEDKHQYNDIIYTGLVPSVGVEWFLHPNFSFHAEYQATLKIGWEFTKYDRSVIYSSGSWEKQFNKTNGPFLIMTNASQVGISFYFK